VTSAVESYNRQAVAMNDQRGRWHGAAGDYWSARAGYFRMDPRRDLDPNLAMVAELVGSEDTLIDVGGGAGRTCLPLALRCREVLNLEPSAGMRQACLESAAEAGIANVRAVEGAWPAAAEGLSADLVMAFNVTYFVSDIEPFLRAMATAARRRVVIGVWSEPPPNHHRRVAELVHGEPLALAPSYRELLPVLWEMGILPDVRVLPERFRSVRGEPATTREAALRFAAESIGSELTPGLRAKLEPELDRLFTLTDGVYRPAWMPDPREMLITWTV
jgi:hypothetical protein